MDDSPSDFVGMLERQLRDRRRAMIVNQPGVANTPDQIAAQQAWVEGKPFVVLTPGSSTLAPETQVLFGGGRTIIPIPIIVSNSYAAPTGTVSRATFATSTVTTAQLAQRVAALIQDLQAVKLLPTSS